MTIFKGFGFSVASLLVKVEFDSLQKRQNHRNTLFESQKNTEYSKLMQLQIPEKKETIVEFQYFQDIKTSMKNDR